MGLTDTESAVQMARVIGSSMARIAEAEAGPRTNPVLFTSSGDSVVDADRFAARASESIPAMARMLEYVWRRHLQAATRRAMLARARGLSEGTRPVMAVGFADMVGFTVLSQHLGDEELAAIVARFEELAHDTVVALGGRVVKMIGDEVMFVVQSPVNAARIGLSLSEAYAGDELISDVRVALAIGPTLLQEGDYYGPVVNLASRLVAVAHPGTVLVSDELHTELVDEGADEFETRPLRPRTLKDIGRVQAWKLIRAGSEPGADRRRNVRWERLSEVLSQLDEVRDRGERLVVERSRPRRKDQIAEDGADGSEGARVPTEPAVQSPSSRAVAMANPPRGNRPSKGACARPRRSTSHPDRPVTSTSVGSGPGLKTRSSSRPASRRSDETCAPRTASAEPRPGRCPPPKEAIVSRGRSTSSAAR